MRKDRNIPKFKGGVQFFKSGNYLNFHTPSMDTQILEKQERLYTDSYSHTNDKANMGKITKGLQGQEKTMTYWGNREIPKTRLVENQNKLYWGNIIESP